MPVATPQQIGRPAGAHNTNRPWYALSVEWMQHKACSWETRDLFFAEDEPKRVVARFAETEAKAICRTCPVQAECLTYAIEGDMYGIWGGTTRKERDDARKAQRRGRVRGDPPTTR